MLTILDLDQTLVERYTATPVPGVITVLDALVACGTQLIIATNQAGPAWRLATSSPRFPTARQVCARFEAIAQALPQLRTATWLVATYDSRLTLTAAQYEQIVDTFNGGSTDLNIVASADPAWRKPEPGMLWEACRISGVSPSNARFVGDMDSDLEAAQRAGIDFWPASDFHETKSVAPHEARQR